MIKDAENLVLSWDSLRQGYYPGDRQDMDALVLDCIRRLRQTGSDGGPDDRTFYTLGLVLLSAYALWHPESGVEDQTVSALLASAPDTGSAACDHPGHPADGDDLDMLLEGFPNVLRAVAGLPGGDWVEPDASDDLDAETPAALLESRWRCPRNIASLVAKATDGFRPGIP